LEFKDDKILYVVDPESQKSKEFSQLKITKKKFKNEIFEELTKSKLKDQIKLKSKINKESVKTNKTSVNSILRDNTIDSHSIPILERNTIDKDRNKNNLSIISKQNSDTVSIYFKDELKDVYNNNNKNNKKDKNKLKSISTLNSNSSLSFYSKNSVRLTRIRRHKNREQTIDRLESIDNALSNRFKENKLSNENILNNSNHVDSRYFYEDISTKTINTCSIKDNDSELNDDDFEI